MAAIVLVILAGLLFAWAVFLVARSELFASSGLAAPSDRRSQHSKSTRESSWLGFIGVLSVAVVLLFCSAAAERSRGAASWFSRAHVKKTSQDAPIIRNEGELGYSTSNGCRACHPHEHATWKHSYHSTMTQEATRSTVLGVNGEQTFRAFGVEGRLKQDGDHVLAELSAVRPTTRELEDERKQTLQAPLRLLTGSHHMQVAWMSQGPGKALSQFPFIYLIEEQQWIPRSAAFLSPPRERIDMETGRWNLTCIQCHTTLGRPRVASQDDAHCDSDVAELGISCESCHGPGAAHEALYRNPINRYATHLQGSAAREIVNPASLDHVRSSQVCGQCHGIILPRDRATDLRINDEGVAFRPGDDLKKTWYVFGSGEPMPADVLRFVEAIPRYRDDRFWTDGMVRVSGREYSGLAASKCHTLGELSCLSCHELHQPDEDKRSPKEWANDMLRGDKQGDASCINCHEEFAERVEVERHTHHPVESSGARCMNCHMPFTTYGLLKAIRSHQITSPSAMETYRHGRMNACNGCHLDKTLKWTSETLGDWYGHDKPELTIDEQNLSATLLAAIRGDAGQRALAAWSLGWDQARLASGTDWMAPVLAQLLDDPYYAVRFISYKSLRTLPGYSELQYDFLGSQEKLANASINAYKIWRKGYHDKQGRPELLLTSGGELDHETFARLLRQRDDTLIELRE